MVEVLFGDFIERDLALGDSVERRNLIGLDGLAVVFVPAARTLLLDALQQCLRPLAVGGAVEHRFDQVVRGVEVPLLDQRLRLVDQTYRAGGEIPRCLAILLAEARLSGLGMHERARRL